MGLWSQCFEVSKFLIVGSPFAVEARVVPIMRVETQWGREVAANSKVSSRVAECCKCSECSETKPKMALVGDGNRFLGFGILNSEVKTCKPARPIPHT